MPNKKIPEPPLFLAIFLPLISALFLFAGIAGGALAAETRPLAGSSGGEVVTYELKLPEAQKNAPESPPEIPLKEPGPKGAIVDPRVKVPVNAPEVIYFTETREAREAREAAEAREAGKAGEGSGSGDSKASLEGSASTLGGEAPTNAYVSGGAETLLITEDGVALGSEGQELSLEWIAGKSPRSLPAVPEKRLVRAVFLGDIMVHDQQLKVARQDDGSYDFTPQFKNVKAFLEGAMVIGNLETTLSGEKAGYAGYPRFNSPDSLLDALKLLGVSVVTLANNHIFDRRGEGVVRTIEVLEKNNFFWTGLRLKDMVSGQPLILEYGGIRWAFLNFAYGSNNQTNSEDPENPIELNIHKEEAILAGINIAKEHGSEVIACIFHWGNNYQFAPNELQVKLAKYAVDNGADLVIGHHPHVLQPMTVLPKGENGHAFVAYSLGNFISNQRTTPRERSVILAVDYEKTDSGEVILSRVSVAPIYVWSDCGRKKGKCSIELMYSGELPSETAPPPIPEAVGQGTSLQNNEPSPEPERSLVLYDDGSAHAQEPLVSPENPKTPSPPAAVPAPSQEPQAPLPEEAPKVPRPEMGPKEFQRILGISKKVVEFLGAESVPDERGFYTIWDAQNPDKLPESSSKTPG